jgi:hypothetical protein
MSKVTLHGGLRRLAPLALAAVAACSSGDEASDGTITLQLATRARSAAASSGLASLDGGTATFTDGTNTLVLTKVELVLEEFALQEDDGDFGCTGPVVAPDTVPACDVWLAPRQVLDLPLEASGALRAFAAEAAPGLYHTAGFHVKPVEADEDAPDAIAFRAGHPEFDGLSVRATGTWNGAPFTYVGRPDREFGLWFEQPLVVSEGASAQVTIFVELARWFRDGTALVDPTTALPGGPNEALVRGNIEAAFSVFEDEDGDGVGDDADEPDDDAPEADDDAPEAPQG